MKSALDRFWFVEAPAARLAWLRLLIGAFALWHVGSRYSSYVAMGDTKASLFESVGAVTFLKAPLVAGLWNGLIIAALVANIFFIVGAFHRFSGPLFGALLLIVLCYRNSWGMVYHTDNLLVLHVIVLGVSRSADALSLDAFRHRRREALAEEISWEYGWPIRLLCAITVSTYLLSGMAKVAGPLGWAWVHGEAFRSQIAMDALRKELLGKTPSSLAFDLYDQVALFTIALERIFQDRLAHRLAQPHVPGEEHLVADAEPALDEFLVRERPLDEAGEGACRDPVAFHVIA